MTVVTVARWLIYLDLPQVPYRNGVSHLAEPVGGGMLEGAEVVGLGIEAFGEVFSTWIE
jgi:hypothetical protein